MLMPSNILPQMWNSVILTTLWAFVFLPIWLPLVLCALPDRVTRAVFRDLWLVVAGSIVLDLLGLLLAIIVDHWQPELGRRIGHVVMCMSFNVLPALWLAFAGTLARLTLALRRRWWPMSAAGSNLAAEPPQCPMAG
jgi:hypothetical protein